MAVARGRTAADHEEITLFHARSLPDRDAQTAVGRRGHIVAGRRSGKLPGVAQGKAQETIVTSGHLGDDLGIIASSGVTHARSSASAAGAASPSIGTM